MTDTKLDPRSLTAEERAIVDLSATHKHLDRAPGKWSDLYELAMSECEGQILARRALFGDPAPEKAAKVECWHCKQRVSHQLDHWASDGIGANGSYTCQPAPPEPAAMKYRFCRNGCGSQVTFVDGGTGPCPDCDKPAAPVEMPDGYTLTGALDVVAHVCKFLLMHENSLGNFPTAHELKDAVDSLEREWRNHAQPVGMTKELEMVLSIADEAADKYVDAGWNEAPKKWRKAIAAVREQYGRKG